MTSPRGLAWALGVLLTAGHALAADPPPSRIHFVNRAEEAGLRIRTLSGDPARNYIIETLGSGAALFDYDGDDDLDLYVANGSRLEPIPPGEEPHGALYRNDGPWRYTDVTRAAGLALHFWGFGTATGDFDNDGDPDLYVTAWGPNHLFRNNGDGTFTDVAERTGTDDARFGASAAFLDYDQDGDLDLYVANYVTFDPAAVPRKGDPDSPCNFRGLTVMCGPHGLPGAVDVLYRNNGDGTFTDVSLESGLFTDGGYYGLGVTAADMDGDGRVDILVANDSTPNHFYRNLGDGRFSDEALMAGFAYSNDGREQAGMGIEASDLDGDGDEDTFVTNFSHDYSTLSLNDGKGMLEDASVRLGLFEPTVRTLGWGTVLADFDADGDRDIFIANGHVYPEVEAADIGTTYRQQNQILENLGNLSFREVPHDMPADLHRGTAAGDIDGDGDIDLVVTVQDAVPELLENRSETGSWVMFRLVGRGSNRDAVGARVTIHAGGHRIHAQRRGGGSFLSASDPRIYVGLGTIRSIERVEVAWPSGRQQTLENPAPGRVHVILEDAGAAGEKPPAGRSSP